MQTVLAAVSMVSGIGLVDRGTDPSGWTAYEFLMPNDDRYPLSLGPISLRRSPVSPSMTSPLSSAARWKSIAEVEYGALTGDYAGGSEFDNLTSLAQGTGTRGTLRFVDADADGMAGDGDRIEARLATPVHDAYQLDLLVLGGGGFAGVSGSKPILRGPLRPFEASLFGQTVPFHQLVLVSETGGTSTVELRHRVGAVRPYSEYTYSLYTQAGQQSGDLRSGTHPTPSGQTVTVTDTNGLVDDRDRIAIMGFANRTEVTLSLRHANGMANSIRWITGYGHVAGRLPDVSWSASGTSPYTFRSTFRFDHSEFALGRTLAVSVSEDGSLVVDHAPLAGGIFASWANGDVSFMDRDGDGSWSSGDEFLVQASNPHRYRLEVSALFDSRTYATEWGP